MKRFLAKCTLGALLLLCGVAATTENCDCNQLTGTQKEHCLEREERYRKDADKKLKEARAIVLGTNNNEDGGTRHE